MAVLPGTLVRRCFCTRARKSPAAGIAGTSVPGSSQPSPSGPTGDVEHYLPSKESPKRKREVLGKRTHHDAGQQLIRGIPDAGARFLLDDFHHKVVAQLVQHLGPRGDPLSPIFVDSLNLFTHLSLQFCDLFLTFRLLQQQCQLGQLRGKKKRADCWSSLVSVKKQKNITKENFRWEKDTQLIQKHTGRRERERDPDLQGAQFDVPHSRSQFVRQCRQNIHSL